jgi:hypothetical protein
VQRNVSRVLAYKFYYESEAKDEDITDEEAEMFKDQSFFALKELYVQEIVSLSLTDANKNYKTETFTKDELNDMCSASFENMVQLFK